MSSNFHRISLNQLFFICKILAQSRFLEVEFIKRKFMEVGPFFEENLSLLIEIGVVKKQNDSLEIANFININSKEEFSVNLLKRFTNSRGLFSKEIREFLFLFSIQNDEIAFFADFKKLLQFSEVRNFLVELNFISRTSDGSGFIINKEFYELFHLFIEKKQLSVSVFKKQITAQEKIGLNAEIAVIEFEKTRLDNIFFEDSEIEHISTLNVSAGYDIKSFENYLDRTSHRIRRFIEVKAVSKTNYQFFWSRNEIGVAKVLGTCYYLYLLPVLSDNSFDFESLEMLPDPYNCVFSNEMLWQKDVELFQITKLNKT